MEYKELHRILDQVTPSRDREEAMLRRLLQEERTANNMKTGRRAPKVAAAGLAAAMVLTTCAFAVVTGLDRRLLSYFGAGPEQEELLSSAAMVVDKELTDQGTTLHVRQVVADRYSALVLMDLTAPEGTVLDGDYYSLGKSVKATAPDGSKMDGWGTGWELLEDEDPTDNHISLLLNVNTIDGDFNFLGAKLTLDFEGLYDSNVDGKLLAEGRWKCTVTLPTEDPGRYVTPNTPIEVGGNRVTLASLYVSPLSFAWELGEGEDDLESMDSTALHGTREDWPERAFLTLEDGRTVPVGEFHFLLTTYKTDCQEADRGRYCFRLSEIIDPAEAASVSLFGQSFALEG